MATGNVIFHTIVNNCVPSLLSVGCLEGKLKCFEVSIILNLLQLKKKKPLLNLLTQQQKNKCNAVFSGNLLNDTATIKAL